ncbi:PWI domain-containing protein [Wilcoxina mikolae CBS 423.85]|nr:PWI domain-containing protein [Wilcoxina mikolae CBS 423.85]
MASGVDAKLLKSTKFPPEYSKKVDMQKVNLEVMKQWIAQKVVDILATEDDVVIDFIFGMLEEDRFPDPKKIQLNITGFLEKDTPSFCKQLWNLLLSAQANPQGVPTELLEKKKEELRLQKLETEKAAEQQRLRREKEDTKGREIDNVRQREREERGGGGGGRRNNGPPPPRRRSETPPSSARGSRPSRRDDYSPPPRGGRGGGGGDRYGTRGGRRETDTQESQILWTSPPTLATEA